MMDAVDALAAEVQAATSATAVLQRRCPGGVIRAEVDRGIDVRASDGQRARLKAGPHEPVEYRRVRLMCGTTLLLTADNWYVPARLTCEIRAALATDAPFGAVIRSLRPIRTTLSADRLGDDPVLRIHALVSTGDGAPLAEVREDYARAALPEMPGPRG